LCGRIMRMRLECGLLFGVRAYLECGLIWSAGLFGVRSLIWSAATRRRFGLRRLDAAMLNLESTHNRLRQVAADQSADKSAARLTKVLINASLFAWSFACQPSSPTTRLTQLRVC